ncbi:MAG: response regulator [Spirulinaceae cyanobacterium]
MSITTHATGISRLRSQLALYSKQKFTGRLDITVMGRTWSLYISLGFLVWGTGGLHQKRRWRRQLVHCGHKAYASPITFRETDEYECWDYHALTLLSERQTIAPQQIMSVVRGTIGEVLFDMMQAIATLPDPNAFEIQPRLGLRPSSSSTGILRRKWTLEIENALKEVEIEWQRWIKAGLVYYSPDGAPYVQDVQQLRLATSALLYQKLSGLVTGRSPLRDLAAIAAKDVTFLGQSLSWYFRHNLIGLRPIPDLSTCYVITRGDRPQTPLSNRINDGSPRPIVQIDSCPRSCELMANLLKPQGYDIIAIREGIQALPLLMKCQPSLIFLDSTLPIVNGYELCSQIRRIQDFQNIPIVILSDRNGFIDRMRANLVGATDFLTKPIEAQNAIAIVEKYLTEAETWTGDFANNPS